MIEIEVQGSAAPEGTSLCRMGQTIRIPDAILCRDKRYHERH